MKRSLSVSLHALAVAACFAGAVAGVAALAILVCGCGSPQMQAGTANRQTHDQTGKLNTLVTTAQQANADADKNDAEADQDLADAENMDDAPPAVRVKIESARKSIAEAHAKHQAVEAALRPIVPDILPRINDAADRALAAEQRAQNATTGKVYLIAAFAVGVGIAIAVAHAGCGLGISIAVGAVAAVLMGVVVGSISALFDLWFPWIVGAALIGAVVWGIEVHFKGGLLPALHSWFDKAKAGAKNLPADLQKIRGELETLKASVASVPGFVPTPEAPKAA